MRLNSNAAVSDSGFVFNSTTGSSYSVNPIGRQIIQWYQQGFSREKIIDLVVEEYHIDADSVDRDLYDFERLLITHKLVLPNEE